MIAITNYVCRVDGKQLGTPKYFDKKIHSDLIFLHKVRI